MKICDKILILPNYQCSFVSMQYNYIITIILIENLKILYLYVLSSDNIILRYFFIKILNLKMTIIMRVLMRVEKAINILLFLIIYSYFSIIVTNKVLIK